MTNSEHEPTYPEENLCEDLLPVGRHLRQAGYSVTYAGSPWSHNCNHWVYFNTVLDVEALQDEFGSARPRAGPSQR